MATVSGIQVLVLEGSSGERGRIHGETLKSRILTHLDEWKDMLGKDTGMDPDEYLAQFLAETAFLPAVQKWTPHLLEEVQGIAEATGVDLETIFAIQLVDEEWWYRRGKKLRQASHAAEHCSGLGVFDQDGPPLQAQNMDVPAYYDGYQVLLHLKDPASAVESFVFATAGLIALNGLNNHSVAICCNTLFQLDHAHDGLPVAFVVRGVLAQSNQRDAITFVQRAKHASGQNYLIGGPRGVRSFECSAAQVREFVPYPGARRVYHTNHPLANDDQAMFKEMLGRLSPEQREQADKGQANTVARFGFLESQLSDLSETITVEKVKTMLSSHEAPVCNDRHPGRALTLGCTIMELSPAPVLHLAPGPPCSTPFETHTFDEGRR